MATEANIGQATGRSPEVPAGGGTRRALGRRAVTVVAGGGLAALSAGCGGGQPGAMPDTGAPPAPITLEYWTFYNEERLAPIRSHLATWEQQTRHITVDVTITASMNELHEKAQVSLAAGTPPDAAMTPRFLAIPLNDNGQLLNLAPLLRRDHINLQRDFTLSGYEIWCTGTFHFPMVGWSLAIAYNKTLFRERGVPDPWDAHQGQWTWDHFLEAATRLTQDKGGDGKPDVFGFQPDGHAVERAFQPFIATNGGEIFDYDAMRYTLDHPKTVEALEWLLELTTKRRVMSGPVEAAELRRAVGGDPFAAGRLAMAGDFSYRPAPGAIEKIGGRFEWDVVPLPRGRRGEPAVSLAWDAPNMVFRQGKHPEAAYELTKLLGGEEVQRAWGEWRGVQPALLNVRRDLKGFLKAPPDHMQVYNDVWESKHYRDASMYHYGDFEAAPLINAHVQAAFEGKTAMREALQQANREANALVHYGRCRFKPPWKRRSAT